MQLSVVTLNGTALKILPLLKPTCEPLMSTIQTWVEIMTTLSILFTCKKVKLGLAEGEFEIPNFVTNSLELLEDSNVKKALLSRTKPESKPQIDGPSND